MSYFSRLRTRLYTFDKDPKKFNTNEITDITNRGRIIQFFQKDRVYDIRYRTVEEGEKPETIAYKEYGDPNLHWVILLLNEIKNPQFEWPKTSVILNEYMEEKYNGSSFFLNVFSDQSDSNCGCGVSRLLVENYLFSPGQTVYLKSIFGGEYEGEIIQFEPKTGEMVILFPSNNFSESETTVNASDYEYINVNTKDLNGDDVSLNIKPFCMKIYSKRKYSLNHFEKNGNYIDFLTPLSSVADDTYNEPTITDETTSFFDAENFCFSETILGTYLGCNENENFVSVDYVVSNQMYEFNLNENRREILLPQKRVVNELIKSFDSLFR